MRRADRTRGAVASLVWPGPDDREQEVRYDYRIPATRQAAHPFRVQKGIGLPRQPPSSLGVLSLRRLVALERLRSRPLWHCFRVPGYATTSHLAAGVREPIFRHASCANPPPVLPSIAGRRGDGAMRWEIVTVRALTRHDHAGPVRRAGRASPRRHRTGHFRL